MKKWTDEKVEELLIKLKENRNFEPKIQEEMDKNKQEIWNKIKGKIEMEEHQEHRKYAKRWQTFKHYSLVASLLVIIGVGTYIPLSQQERRELKQDKSKEIMIVADTKEVTTLTNEETKKEGNSTISSTEQKEELLLNEEFYLEKKQQIGNETWYYYHHSDEPYIFIERESFEEQLEWKKDHNSISYYYDYAEEVLYINDFEKNKGIYIEKKLNEKQVQKIIDSFVRIKNNK